MEILKISVICPPQSFFPGRFSKCSCSYKSSRHVIFTDSY